MKAIKMLMMVALTIFSVALFAQDTTKQKSKMKMEQVKYSCQMHPDVNSDKPGKCSKCGMDLKEIPTVVYACPMKCEGIKHTISQANAPNVAWV